jgi:hypothetical protein
MSGIREIEGQLRVRLRPEIDASQFSARNPPRRILAERSTPSTPDSGQSHEERPSLINSVSLHYRELGKATLHQP